MRLTQTVSWQGRTIAWDCMGSGPALVFGHGTPWSSWLWSAIGNALSRDFTVYWWDMPGYGQSSMQADHAVGLDVQGQALAHLLKYWGLERPHVIAHDYGGAVSLRALLLHGARYASLCLVDVVALRPWGSEFFRLVAQNAPVFMALPPHIHRGVLSAYIQSAAHRPLAPHALDALMAPWLSKQGQQAFYRQIAEADEQWTAELEPLLASIDVPTHIIWGHEDTWIPVDRAHRLQAQIPGAGLDIVADAGHLIQLDAPEALTAALYRWLHSQLSASAG